MFEQCMAQIKLLGETYPHRCPAPALPGEPYCPLHLVLEGRMKERFRKRRELLKYYRKEVTS